MWLQISASAQIGKTIVTTGAEGIRLWNLLGQSLAQFGKLTKTPDESLDIIDGALVKPLKTNPNVKPEDCHFCEGIETSR